MTRSLAKVTQRKRWLTADVVGAQTPCKCRGWFACVLIRTFLEARQGQNKIKIRFVLTSERMPWANKGLHFKLYCTIL
jgi:hypothetical protein